MKNKTAVDEMFKIIECMIEYSPNNPLLEQLMAAKPRLKELEKQQTLYALNYYSDIQININLLEHFITDTYGGENNEQ